MRTRNLLLASAVLIVIGLGSLWSKWNGTAGVNAGDSINAWAVRFSGSVEGWPALIGIVAIVAAVLVFVVALIRSVLPSS